MVWHGDTIASCCSTMAQWSGCCLNECCQGGVPSIPKPAKTTQVCNKRILWGHTKCWCRIWGAWKWYLCCGCSDSGLLCAWHRVGWWVGRWGLVDSRRVLGNSTLHRFGVGQRGCAQWTIPRPPFYLRKWGQWRWNCPRHRGVLWRRKGVKIQCKFNINDTEGGQIHVGDPP